jgi:hypothetical protein
LLTDQNSISNLNKGPSIDASNQGLVHLDMQVQREKIFLEIDQPETRIAYGGHVC